MQQVGRVTFVAIGCRWMQRYENIMTEGWRLEAMARWEKRGTGLNRSKPSFLKGNTERFDRAVSCDGSVLSHLSNAIFREEIWSKEKRHPIGFCQRNMKWHHLSLFRLFPRLKSDGEKRTSSEVFIMAPQVLRIVGKILGVDCRGAVGRPCVLSTVVIFNRFLVFAHVSWLSWRQVVLYVLKKLKLECQRIKKF